MMFINPGSSIIIRRCSRCGRRRRHSLEGLGQVFLASSTSWSGSARREAARRILRQSDTSRGGRQKSTTGWNTPTWSSVTTSPSCWKTVNCYSLQRQVTRHSSGMFGDTNINFKELISAYNLYEVFGAPSNVGLQYRRGRLGRDKHAGAEMRLSTFNSINTHRQTKTDRWWNKSSNRVASSRLKTKI